MGPPAKTLEVFIDLPTEGTPEIRQTFYDELLMYYVIDFASRWPRAFARISATTPASRD